MTQIWLDALHRAGAASRIFGAELRYSRHGAAGPIFRLAPTQGIGNRGNFPTFSTSCHAYQRD